MITLPQRITLTNWAAALEIDFPEDNVPALSDEENWKEWGNLLVQENSFTRNGAPGTSGYSDWESWARAVYYTMANF